jgi:hypothetical protein
MASNTDKKIQDFLKPQLGSKVKQGYFTPKNPEKYDGDPSNIIYRSSWELKFLTYCDNNDSIIKYAAEKVGVPYINPILKKESTYWIDCSMITKAPDGTLTKWLIEIKPNKYLTPPEAPTRLTEKATLNYAHHAKAYIINTAKFNAAKVWAHKNGMRFGIITENFLFNRV